MHDTQEKLFDVLITPISLAEMLFCDRNSMPVGTKVARGCVKAGISSNLNCSDFGGVEAPNVVGILESLQEFETAPAFWNVFLPVCSREIYTLNW